MALSKRIKHTKNSSSMKETLKFIWENSRPYKKSLGYLLILTLMIEAMSLVSPYITGSIIDTLVTYYKTGNTIDTLVAYHKAGNIIEYFRDGHMAAVSRIILIGFGLALFSRALWIAKSFVDIKKFFFDFRKSITLRGVEKILQFSVGQHTDKNSGVKDSIITKGTASSKRFIEVILYNLLPTSLKTLTILIAIFYTDWQLGLLALISSVLIVALQIKISKSFIPKFQDLEKLSQDRHKGFWEVLRNVFLVKNSGREMYGYDHIENLIEKENAPSKKFWVSFVFKIHGSSALIAVASYIFTSIAVFKIVQGSLTIGTLVILTSWAGMLFSELYMFQSIQRSFATEFPAIVEFKKLMDVKPAIKQLKSALKPKNFEGKIEFQNVSFFYPDDEENENSVLDSVSFTINP